MYPSSFSNLARQGMAQGLYHRQPAHALPQQASPMAMQNHAMMGGQVQPPNGLLGRPMGPQPGMPPNPYAQNMGMGGQNSMMGQQPNGQAGMGNYGMQFQGQPQQPMGGPPNPYGQPAGVQNSMVGGQMQNTGMGMYQGQQQNMMNGAGSFGGQAQGMGGAMVQQPTGQAGMGNYGMQFQGQPQQPMGGVSPNPYASAGGSIWG